MKPLTATFLRKNIRPAEPTVQLPTFLSTESAASRILYVHLRVHWISDASELESEGVQAAFAGFGGHQYRSDQLGAGSNHVLDESLIELVKFPADQLRLIGVFLEPERVVSDHADLQDVNDIESIGGMLPLRDIWLGRDRDISIGVFKPDGSDHVGQAVLLRDPSEEAAFGLILAVVLSHADPPFVYEKTPRSILARGARRDSNVSSL